MASGKDLRFDFRNMYADRIGTKGIEQAEMTALAPCLEAARAQLYAERGTGWTGWMNLPTGQENVVSDILETAASVREWADAFVVLGIGGSALGPSAVHRALCHLHYNELPAEKRGGPRFYVEDNVDPERMAALLDVINPEKTCFNVITKSGGTSETMSQFLILQKILKEKLGASYTRNMIATTDAQKGNLIKIARAEGFKTFVIPAGVGGRFSELCPVGLLPAAVCGIDIRAMLKGADAMDALCQEQDMQKNPAMLGAGLSYLAMKKGINISVMMPYADSLKLMSDWYAQLWAESLGKAVDKEGNCVHVGQTPVKALGVTDQHSQVQLYPEGPFDKMTIFVGVDAYRANVGIPHGFEDIPAVSFLGGHTMNELISAEQLATEYALFKAGRINQTIMFPEVSAYTVGQFLYYFEVVTAFTGSLLNIDAFNQPGVEAVKEATYALLGRPGFEEKRAELQSYK